LLIEANGLSETIRERFCSTKPVPPVPIHAERHRDPSQKVLKALCTGQVGALMLDILSCSTRMPSGTSTPTNGIHRMPVSHDIFCRE
jgi:hypothetical protein